tara:strand:+ start:1590 stop:3860 length:2271 start_codon:yes stop_codon:yes gene_type:complete
MSQNFSRGLENEYLVPYISFTTHPQSGSIVGGGTTTLTAVAAASTGIGYLNYRWYQDDILSGGITTALSGVTTTRSYTLNYAGDNLSRVVNYKVSAEWVPDNSDLIVSHGTPGVGATGVGVGQSISGYSPSGETFSNVGVVSVAPAITVNVVAVGVQPLGFNTSSYNLSRSLSVSATISNGDNGNLTYQWKNAGTNVSGATSSSYTFAAGHVGLNTYTCLVSYPTDGLVSSVTSDSITDNSTELTKTIRLEYMPAGGEKVSSSTDYDVYSEDVDLSDYANGFKIDLNHVQEVINTAGSRNTSVYAWENYYYVSMFSKDDDITVDLEMGGAMGDGFETGSSPTSGGRGGWMVIQGTMEKEKEFVGIAATGQKSTRRPATAVYETGSVIGIVGNGGRGGTTHMGGDGGADSPAGTVVAGGGSLGGWFAPNTLNAEGSPAIPTANAGRGVASRCPKGSSWYQNRYGACETFTSKLRDPDGVEYPVATNSNNTEITRGFKMTNLYLDNGNHTSDTTHGTGGAGVEGGGASVTNGGGGGSGYYGGNWTKLASILGGNDSSDRTWTYGTNLTQTVNTDGINGYIRVWGRGGSTGNNPLVTTKNASIVRNPASLTRSGLFLDLTSWASTEEVLVRAKVDVTSTNSSVIQYLTSGGTFSYAFQGNSDEYLTNMGTTVMTVNKNSGTVDQWLSGGAYYQFRTTNETSPENGSGIYQGGENQGGNAGVASGGEFNITLHDTGSSGGPDNTGANADLRVTWSIQGER